MKRVRLQVVLDEPGRLYAPEETVSGRVEIEVDEPVTCEAVRCFLRWRVAGDANSAEGDSGPMTIGSGEWKGGDRRSYPFRIPVPAGPPTYDGRRFSVVWSAVAEALLAWAVDPEAEAPLRVGPATGGEGGLLEKKETGGFELGCAVVCALLLLVPLAVLLLSRGFAGVGWVVVACLGGLGALVMVPNAVARRRLGPVVVECGPSPVRPGEEFAMRIVVHPRKRIVPKTVQAVLIGVEQSVKGSGKSRKTHNEELAKRKAVLEGPEAVAAGAEGEWAGIVLVPEDAAPTFEAGPHKVAWKARFVIDQSWLPEASWEVDVVVA